MSLLKNILTESSFDALKDFYYVIRSILNVVSTFSSSLRLKSKLTLRPLFTHDSLVSKVNWISCGSISLLMTSFFISSSFMVN